MDWKSQPIYDKYPDEDYEFCKQIEDDDDETSFVQIQKVVDFTKENYSKVRFIVVAIEQVSRHYLLKSKIHMLIFLGLTNIYFLMIN